MKDKERESLNRLKESIRQQREKTGLPQEGSLPPQVLLEAMRKKPPLKEITAFVRGSLQSDSDKKSSQILAQFSKMFHKKGS